MTEPHKSTARPQRQRVLATREEPERARDAAHSPVDLPGFRIEPSGRVSQGGHATAGEPRRLGDLLNAGREQPLYLADRDQAASTVARGDDPVLYRALRDVYPPRRDPRRPVRADLVVYEPGELPGGEPYRSLGHWNPPGQVEVFHVLSGRVVMLVAGLGPGGRPFSYLQPCIPGDVAAVPLGAWHVSYVVDGPAAVFNVYAELGSTEHGPDGEAEGGKYRRAAPVQLALCRGEDGLDLDGTTRAWESWGGLDHPPAARWLSAWLDTERSLAGLFVEAPADSWDDLLDRYPGAAAFATDSRPSAGAE